MPAFPPAASPTPEETRLGELFPLPEADREAEAEAERDPFEARLTMGLCQLESSLSMIS
jgi:hypothetical protein